MTDRFKNLFELKITLGNIITLITVIALGYAGYVELRANHINLKAEVEAHKMYDDKRFETLATKETRDMRDRWVDDQLKEILTRVRNIEAIHTKP